MTRRLPSYWEMYWKLQRKPEICGICHDTGFVSAARDNVDTSMKVQSCFQCKNPQKIK